MLRFSEETLTIAPWLTTFCSTTIKLAGTCNYRRHQEDSWYQRLKWPLPISVSFTNWRSHELGPFVSHYCPLNFPPRSNSTSQRLLWGLPDGCHCTWLVQLGSLWQHEKQWWWILLQRWLDLCPDERAETAKAQILCKMIVLVCLWDNIHNTF